MTGLIDAWIFLAFLLVQDESPRQHRRMRRARPGFRLRALLQPGRGPRCAHDARAADGGQRALGGGQAGRRVAVVVRGPDHEPLRGRGVRGARGHRGDSDWGGTVSGGESCGLEWRECCGLGWGGREVLGWDGLHPQAEGC